MVAFITELNANFYSIWFIRENGSDQYYRHNKGLLFDDRQKRDSGTDGRTGKRDETGDYGCLN